jgi:hypothetical protein
MKKRILPFVVLVLTAGISFAGEHTLKVVVPDEVQVCYLAGSFNNWDPAADTMTRVSDSPKTYSMAIEVADEDVATTEYKYLAGPAWKYQQEQSAHFKLSGMDADGDTVSAFQAYYDPGQESDVTIDVLVPVDVFVCYLTGSFNGWNSNSDQMAMVDSTVNGKEFTLTIHTIDTTTLEYKFLAGPGWPYEQTNSANYVYMTDGGTVVCDEFKAIYDPSKVGDITINITVPEGTAEVWVVGSYNSWDIANAIQASKNPDGTFTAVIPMVADIEYKIWCHNEWAYEEAADAQGTSLASNRTASFVDGPVYNITVAYWKELYVPSGIVRQPDRAVYRAYADNGRIFVEGVKEGVSVFDISGRMIDNARIRGTYTSGYLKTGVYILRIDDQAQKLYVW